MKKMKLLFFGLLLLFPSFVYASDCTKVLPALKFVGHIVAVVKILIPIIIIGLGIMDFFKAVVASKDDEIKKSTRSLIFRCIAGVVIFFLPAFIDLIFSWVSDFKTYESDYKECISCIWNVNGGDCQK